MPGNPWPHDMVIRIEDDAAPLLELLWVREARELHPVGDVPPPLIDIPEPAGPTSDPYTTTAWTRAWPQIWAGAVSHAAGITPRPSFDDLSGTADGSPKRAELLDRMRGPSWRGRFGDAALGPGFAAWTERRFRGIATTRPRRLARTPERMALQALIPAWEAGLETVVTIPCRGEHTRRVGASGLLMTEATRDDPEHYAAALRTFG